MEVIKKYTAIQLTTKVKNDNVGIKLGYGEVTGPHYSLTYPQQEFNSEEEAIKYAYETNAYIKWLIVPIIKFG